MKNLLYKEFKLSIHPAFYIVVLTAALILIPSWLYFIAMSYIFFISISNIFSLAKSNNDIGFSLMMPVRRKDIVKARIISIISLELLQIAVSVIFAVINQKIYINGNFFMEPNIAFFGFVFIMYAIFNAIFFPMFYKTGYKIGRPVVIAIAAAFIFAAFTESLVLLVPIINKALDSPSSDMLVWKLLVLTGGIVIFHISTKLTYKISAKRFEKVDV